MTRRSWSPRPSWSAATCSGSSRWSAGTSRALQRSSASTAARCTARWVAPTQGPAATRRSDREHRAKRCGAPDACGRLPRPCSAFLGVARRTPRVACEPGMNRAAGMGRRMTTSSSSATPFLRPTRLFEPRRIGAPPSSTAVGPAKRGVVLVIDDDRQMAEFVQSTVCGGDQEVVSCSSAAVALELVAERDFDVILTDPNVGGAGLSLCERLVAMRPNVPLVVVTGQASLDAAIGAIRVGAYDFVTKPIDTKVLAVALSRALQYRRLRKEGN